MSVVSYIPGERTPGRGSPRLSRRQRSSRGIWGAASGSGPRNVPWNVASSARGLAPGAAYLTLANARSREREWRQELAWRPGWADWRPCRCRCRCRCGACKAARSWFAHVAEGPAWVWECASTGPPIGMDVFKAHPGRRAARSGPRRWARAVRGEDAEPVPQGAHTPWRSPPLTSGREHSGKSTWRRGRAWRPHSSRRGQRGHDRAVTLAVGLEFHPAEMDGILVRVNPVSKGEGTCNVAVFFLFLSLAVSFPGHLSCVPVRKGCEKWWGAGQRCVFPSSPRPTGTLPSVLGESRGSTRNRQSRPWPRGGEGPEPRREPGALSQSPAPERTGHRRKRGGNPSSWCDPRKALCLAFLPGGLNSQPLLFRELVSSFPNKELFAGLG